MKWVPAPFWFILAPRARGWGMVWLLASAALSLVTLPLTIVQLQALFGFGAAADPARLPGPAVGHHPVAVAGRRPGPLAPAGDVAGDAGGLAFRAGAASTIPHVPRPRNLTAIRGARPARTSAVDGRQPDAGTDAGVTGTSSRRRSSTGRRQIAART